MADQTSLEELLLRYDELRQQGQAISPEELCGEHTELLEEVRREIQELEALNRLLGAAASETDPHATEPGPATPSTAFAPQTNSVSTGSRYRVLRLHARGGLGEVHLARDERLHREVALKFMQKPCAQDPNSRRRFLWEAEITSRLEHPNIVPVYALGQDADGHPFYAMRFIRGETLQEAIQRFHAAEKSRRDSGQRSLAFRELLSRFVAVCNTIAYAHSRGVLHRDVKPDNILLGKYGETLLVDWGLAKPFTGSASEPSSSEEPLHPNAGGDTERTQLGEVIGTPVYMSPEQAVGEWQVVGPASDIYSLGATFYVLLTGQSPFEGGHVGEVLAKVRRGDFLPPRQRKKEIPRALEAICLKAMALKPEERYATALELSAELEHWLAAEPVAAYREPLIVRAGRWMRRHRTAVMAAGAAVVVAALSLAVATALLVHANDATERAATEARLNAAEANQQRLQSERRELTLIVDRGLSLCEQGEVGWGMLWLARGLEVAPADAEDLRRTIRANLAGWYGRLTPPKLSLQHQGPVVAVAFSPDGKIVLTGSHDRSAQLWEAATGRPLGTPLQHQDWVEAVAFSHDGKTIVTGSHDKSAQLWDVATSKRLGPPLQHQGPVRAVAFSPDGKTVLTGSHDKSAQQWEAATSKPLGPPLQHPGAVRAVAFCPDGKTILTGTQGDDAYLWEAGTGRRLGPSFRHHTSVNAVAFSPDGRTVLTGSEDRTARLWETATGQAIGPPLRHQHAVYAVAFSPDGRTVLTGSGDATARLWERAKGKRYGPPLRHRHAVWAVAFSPDGKTVLTGSQDNTAQLWQVAKDQRLGPPLRHGLPVYAVAFSPDGQTVLTGTGEQAAAHFWGRAKGKRFGPTLRHQNAVGAVTFSSDGKAVLTGGEDGIAQLWDAATGKPLGPPLRHQSAVKAVALSPNGKIVLTGCLTRTAQLWDATTGGPIGTTLQHQGDVRAVSFSPDGKTVLTGSADGVAQLWDPATGKCLSPPFRHQHAVFAAAFSPNGKLILTGSLDGTAQLWEAATGKPIGQPLHHQSGVYAVAFSADGKTILTGSGEDTARLWDAATSKPLGPLLQHEGQVWAVAFSPDGKTVLTGSEDTTAQLWDVPAPMKGGVGRIVLWTKVMTRMELDPEGAVRELDAQTWQEWHQRLKKLGGPPMPCPPGE